MSRLPVRKQVPSTLVASLLSIVVTLLGVILTRAAAPAGSKYAIPALYLLIVTALVVLGFAHMHANITELRGLRTEMTDSDTLSRLVPTYVTFKRREDTLIVEPKRERHINLGLRARVRVTATHYGVDVLHLRRVLGPESSRACNHR